MIDAPLDPQFARVVLPLKYFSRAHIAVYQRTNGRLGAKSFCPRL